MHREPGSATVGKWVWTTQARNPNFDASEAGVRAMASSDHCKDFFAVLKDLEAAFGGGQGRLLDRLMASEMGDRFRSHLVPGGAREFCYLAETPGRYLLKVPAYIRSSTCPRADFDFGALPFCMWSLSHLHFANSRSEWAQQGCRQVPPAPNLILQICTFCLEFIIANSGLRSFFLATQLCNLSKQAPRQLARLGGFSEISLKHSDRDCSDSQLPD